MHPCFDRAESTLASSQHPRFPGVPALDYDAGRHTFLRASQPTIGPGMTRVGRKGPVACHPTSISGWWHRIARDAHEHKGKGAEKFLDELLVFREHA